MIVTSDGYDVALEMSLVGGPIRVIHYAAGAATAADRAVRLLKKRILEKYTGSWLMWCGILF